MEKEKSVYLELFGDYPINRVLSFLIVNEDFDYSMAEIAKYSGVGYSTLKLFWPYLVESRVVIQTRGVGNAKMCKLNLQNPVVKKFRDFYWAVTKQHVHAELEEEGLIPRAKISVSK